MAGKTFGIVMKIWLNLCFSKSVMKRAPWSAIIVSVILILINHGDAILRRNIGPTRIFQMCLTVIVPYIVSTVSSVSTMLSAEDGFKLENASAKAAKSL